VYDLIIVGAGPAGLACAFEAEKKGLRYLVIDEDVPAGVIISYDILHKLIGATGSKRLHEAPADLPLKGGLCFGGKEVTDIASMIESWQHELEATGINKKIRTWEEVESILKKKNFEVKTNKATYSAKNVVIAIGRSGKPRWLDIAGEKNKDVFHKYIDALDAGVEKIIDKEVLVVGGGDTAVEAALILKKKNKITLSYRGCEFVRPHPQNRKDIMAAWNSGKIEVLLDSHLTNIQEGERLRASLIQKEKKIEKDFDYIFILIGTHPPSEFFDKVGILQEEKISTHESCGITVTDSDLLPVVGINGKYGTNIPGLFVIGDALGRQTIEYEMKGGQKEIQRNLFIRFAIKDGQEVIKDLV